MSTYSAHSKIKQYRDAIAKNDGKSYFDLLNEKREADPDAFNARVNVAEQGARTDCKNFLNKAADFSAYGHEDAYNRYKNEFGSDPAKAMSYFTQKNMALCDAARWEVRNESFENKVLSTRTVTDSQGKTTRTPLNIQTIGDSATITAYRNLMNSLWSAEGYARTEAEAAEFWSHNRLSYDTEPTTTPEAQRDSFMTTQNSAAAVMNRVNTGKK